MAAPEFKPGFRLSVFDLVILALGVAGAVGCLLSPYPVLAWVIVMAVGHFFFFCNVFRISRAPELIWAAAFLGLFGSSLLTSTPSLPVGAVLSIALSSFLIWRETRTPGYHGICWQRWNPGLPEWWQARMTARAAGD